MISFLILYQNFYLNYKILEILITLVFSICISPGNHAYQ